MHQHSALERTFKPEVKSQPVACDAEVMAGASATNPGQEITPSLLEDEMVETSDEVEPLKTAPSPTMPSAAEVEEHRISHIPFRSWCRECVIGRGLGEQRRRHQQRDHKIAIVGVDYFYIATKGIEKRQDMLDEYPLDAEGRRT